MVPTASCATCWKLVEYQVRADVDAHRADVDDRERVDRRVCRLRHGRGRSGRRARPLAPVRRDEDVLEGDVGAAVRPVDRQDRHVGEADHLLRDAPEDVAADAGPAVGPHHHEVGVVVGRVGADLLVGNPVADPRRHRQSLGVDGGRKLREVGRGRRLGVVYLRRLAEEATVDDRQDVDRRVVLSGEFGGRRQCSVGLVAAVRGHDDGVEHLYPTVRATRA